MITTVLCSARTAECACMLAAGVCDGRHLCDCGGSWMESAVLLFPSTLPWRSHVERSDRLFQAGPAMARLILMREELERAWPDGR